MDKKINVSIIIPVHNQFDLLDKCLHSIDEKTNSNEFDYEIVLSDSNSDKNLIEYYELLKYSVNFSEKRLKIISDDIKPGFSRAINNGMKIAKDSDYYVWLNSDTIVTEGWLNGIDICDLCSPISNNASYQSMISIDFQDLDKIEDFMKDMKNDFNYKKKLKCDLLNGFCYIISQEVFKTIGFLDETHFPHYGSEDDYSLRAKLRNFQASILPGNFVFHHGNQSYKQGIDSPMKKQAQVLLQKFPDHWVKKLIMLHTIKTRNLRQLIIERFIEYIEKNN